MKPIFNLYLCLAGVLLLGLTAGCQNVAPKATATQAAVDAPTPPAPQTDLLEKWLTNAPKPEVVSCSVERTKAPEAVDRFTAISEKIATIYNNVYTDAQATATAVNAGDISQDPVLARVAESLTAQNATDWKANAQAAVIANYQNCIKEIDTQKKQLSDYIASLRTDGSITNLTDRVEILGRIGKDSVVLSRQLKDAAEGATAVRVRRIATALGK